MSAEPEAKMEMALRRAAQGDQGAFAEIVSEHQGMVFSIGYHAAARALLEVTKSRSLENGIRFRAR